MKIKILTYWKVKVTMNSWISILTFTFTTVRSAFVVFTALKVTIAFCGQKIISDYHNLGLKHLLHFWFIVPVWLFFYPIFLSMYALFYHLYLQKNFYLPVQKSPPNPNLHRPHWPVLTSHTFPSVPSKLFWHWQSVNIFFDRVLISSIFDKCSYRWKSKLSNILCAR